MESSNRFSSSIRQVGSVITLVSRSIHEAARALACIVPRRVRPWDTTDVYTCYPLHRGIGLNLHTSQLFDRTYGNHGAQKFFFFLPLFTLASELLDMLNSRGEFRLQFRCTPFSWSPAFSRKEFKKKRNKVPTVKTFQKRVRLLLGEKKTYTLA